MNVARPSPSRWNVTLGLEVAMAVATVLWIGQGACHPADRPSFGATDRGRTVILVPVEGDAAIELPPRIRDSGSFAAVLYGADLGSTGARGTATAPLYWTTDAAAAVAAARQRPDAALPIEQAILRGIEHFDAPTLRFERTLLGRSHRLLLVVPRADDSGRAIDVPMNAGASLSALREAQVPLYTISDNGARLGSGQGFVLEPSVVGAGPHGNLSVLRITGIEHGFSCALDGGAYREWDRHAAVPLDGSKIRRPGVAISSLLNDGVLPDAVKPGFHRVECRRSHAPGGGRSARHFEVSDAQWLVVSGRPLAELQRDLNDRRSRRSWFGVYASAVYEDGSGSMLQEALGHATDSESAIQWQGILLDTTPTLAGHEGANIDVCQALEGYVRSGGTLMLSAANVLPWLSRCSALIPPLGGGDDLQPEPTKIDLRPRVTVLLDGSPVGRYRRDASHSCPPRDPVQSPGEALLDGLALQRLFGKELFNELALHAWAGEQRSIEPFGAQVFEDSDWPGGAVSENEIEEKFVKDGNPLRRIRVLRGSVVNPPGGFCPGARRPNWDVVVPTYDVPFGEDPWPWSDGPNSAEDLNVLVVPVEPGPRYRDCTRWTFPPDAPDVLDLEEQATSRQTAISDSATERLDSGRWSVSGTQLEVVSNLGDQHASNRAKALVNEFPGLRTLARTWAQARIDQRRGRVAGSIARAELTDEGNGPLCFSDLHGASTDASAPATSDLEWGTVVTGSEEAGNPPLVRVRSLGLGQVIVFAHSPFERWNDAQEGRPERLFPDCEESDPSICEGPMRSSDADEPAGLDRVADALIAAGQLRSGAYARPAVVDVRQVGDGGIEVTVDLPRPDRGNSEGVEMALDWQARVAELGSDARPAASMALVALDLRGGRATISLGPSELRALLADECRDLSAVGASAPCGAWLSLGPLGASRGDVTQVWAAYPHETSALQRSSDVFVALAAYSGGGPLDRCAPGDAGDHESHQDGPEREDCEIGFPLRGYDLRPVASTLALLAFLALSTLRARRRLRGHASMLALADRESDAQQIFGSPTDVTPATSEAASRLSAEPRWGAIAGRRPLQPGDRLASAPLQDLLLLGERPGEWMPQVFVRAAQAAPRLVVILDVGASMRVPAGNNGDPVKVRLAARVAELLRGHSIAAGGTCEVHCVGMQGPPIVVPVDANATGVEGLHGAVIESLARRPRGNVELTRDWVESLGTVIVISDFLSLGYDMVSKAANALEDDGARFGAVIVHSRAEIQCVEGGLIAGRLAPALRLDWCAEDVAIAYRAHHRAVTKVLGDTTGGVLLATTSEDGESLAELLRASRLLQAIV